MFDTMIIKTCFILWICFVSVNEGVTMGQKYKILEKRLNTIESRLNHQSNDIFELQASIIELNQSFSGNNECPQNELNREEPVTVGVVKEIQEILENDNDILFEAFKEEKTWTHVEIEDQKYKVTELFSQFKGLQSDIKISHKNISERVETLQSHVESVLTNQIQIMNATVLNILNRTKSDENKMKIHVAKVEEKVSILEKTVDRIKMQSAMYSVTLNNLESKISDEIFKIKKELAAEPSCPPNWSKFLGYCYLLYTMKVDIDKAIKICTDSSAFVADIESEVELKYFRALTDQTIWVGITDRQEEGNWKLLRNGKQIRFSNWENGQPQDYAVYDEDCAAMYRESGLWHDFKCIRTFSFICKKMVTF